jgi:thiamine biosynthesis lipoprotein
MTDHTHTGRREVIVAGLGAFVVALVPLVSRRAPAVIRRSLPIMGTVGEVVAVHPDAATAAVAVDAAFDALARVERLMSRFDPASEIGRANAAAGTGAVHVGSDTATVVRAALHWADASGGRFDPALGIVNEAWAVERRHEPPPPTLLRRVAGRHLYRAVEVAGRRGGAVLALGDRDVRLDLGGIAKGHGIDRAVEAMRALGVHDGIVTVGGDLYALGRRPDGDPWRVGVRSPDEPSRLSGRFEASDAGVATSGDYERFFRYRGVVYHHLMDPATAAPRQSAQHSVTVCAPTCRDADAAATTLFGLPREEAQAWLGRHARDMTLVT